MQALQAVLLVQVPYVLVEFVGVLDNMQMEEAMMVLLDVVLMAIIMEM